MNEPCNAKVRRKGIAARRAAICLAFAAALLPSPVPVFGQAPDVAGHGARSGARPDGGHDVTVELAAPLPGSLMQICLHPEYRDISRMDCVRFAFARGGVVRTWETRGYLVAVVEEEGAPVLVETGTVQDFSRDRVYIVDDKGKGLFLRDRLAPAVGQAAGGSQGAASKDAPEDAAPAGREQ